MSRPPAEREVRPAEGARGGLAGWQLRRVTLLAERALPGLTPAALAREVRLSHFHFCRAFQTSTGLPPGRWLTLQRVERAKRLLDTTPLSVTEIARSVGYRGPPQLTRAFQARYGIAPSDYRRR